MELLKEIIMKAFGILFFGLLFAFSLSAQDEASAAGSENIIGAKITFEEESHDFGDITQGDKVDYVFEFENTGNEPLILSNVLTTCGCTATSWPRNPIPPGKGGEIAVTFNSSGKLGQQNKVVTVISNAVNGQEKVRIVTNVLPKEE